MPFIRSIITSLLFFNIFYTNPYDNTTFRSPVTIPLLLSANFGELRVDHFHSGLDIKTQGTIGKEVVASADGYVYRISVSPGGFGKALYIMHPSGYSTVYGHLDQFTPEIEKYVKNQQYEKKSFLIALFPSKERFPVKQGDLIGFSGNSGSSGGPHLHFEIRNSESERPVNPLLFDFGSEDNIRPVIEKLAVYPINRNTIINNSHQIKKIEVSGGNGKYYLSADNKIIISGMAGFGIKASDMLNDSHNKCAVYSIELEIDSIQVYNYKMDGFSFNESRFVNSHIDYATYMKNKMYFERTFVLPNDKLDVYKNVVNRGIFNFNDNKVHKIRITVTDARNNKSSLSFDVKSQSERHMEERMKTDSSMKIMPYNRSNKFVSENISVAIPSGALYDTLSFLYKLNSATSGMLSDLHSVHNKFTPVHKAFTLSIKPSKIPAGKESKMLIVELADDLEKRAINSTWSAGYLTANVLAFGNYYVGADTIAPKIFTNGLVNGVNLSGKKEIRIRITDDFSGIKSYEPSIDGNWALFEYDQKNDVIIYRFDDQRITRGKKHNLSLRVSDNKDNMSYFKSDFIW